jgi:hypothetical protein
MSRSVTLWVTLLTIFAINLSGLATTLHALTDGLHFMTGTNTLGVVEHNVQRTTDDNARLSQSYMSHASNLRCAL